MQPEVHEHGYWQGAERLPHLHDAGFAQALCTFLAGQTVVDFGCGLGDYVKAFRASGIDADGYDGNPQTGILTDGVGQVLDIAAPVDLNRQWDWVTCLEVMEHIPAEYEEAALDCLDRHCRKGIVLSWAVPGQGGLGHFNMQPESYVIGRMAALGYRVNMESSRLLREAATLVWFKKNTLVLEKEIGECVL